MHRFLTHDAIHNGAFNRDFCSTPGHLSCWSAELTNNPKTLSLLIQRLESDWAALNPKMRKPYSFGHVDSRLAQKPLDNMCILETRLCNQWIVLCGCLDEFIYWPPGRPCAQGDLAEVLRRVSGSYVSL